MRMRMASVVVVASTLVLLGSQFMARAEEKKEKASAEDVAAAETRAKEELARLKGEAAMVAAVNEEALARAFPKYLFVSAVFRQYPVARATPEGLNNGNVLAIPRDKDAKVVLLKDVKELEAFFKKNLPPVTDDGLAKDAVRSWLYLDSVYPQDGFFKFALMDDSTKVEAAKPGKVASGKMVVMAGGNGEIEGNLTFDDAGKLTKATESANLKVGNRPICQATKLLDADPIVRKMAEQDLLIMGRAAKPYLDEQRAKATPELQQAIDRMWQRIIDQK